ncbi:MAG: hypothetical protein AB1Z98_25045 [Nannocystaceae bacterium]
MTDQDRKDEDYPLNDEASEQFILSIQSPKSKVRGPHAVVFTDAREGWAIVALHWANEPRLGIRWFWGTMGNPISTGHRTWFIIPSGLSDAILSGLPLSVRLRRLLDEFLYKGDNEAALTQWQADKWPKQTG